MATETPLLTDEIRAQIGNEKTGAPELVEVNMIKEWAKAVAWPDPPNPLYTDEAFARKTRFKGIIAPPMFFTRLGHGLAGQVAKLPPAKATANGEGEHEPLQIIRPGDYITTTCRFADAYEKRGKAGRLLFVTYHYTFRNQLNEVVGRGMRSQIRIH